MTTSLAESTQPLSISRAAEIRIRHILADKGLSADSARVRISVVSGGCSGLTYTLDIEEKESSSISDKDQIFDADGIELIVDMRSYLYLAGTRLEFTDGLTGKGFTFENPNASRTCSCGESFSL